MQMSIHHDEMEGPRRRPLFNKESLPVFGCLVKGLTVYCSGLALCSCIKLTAVCFNRFDFF